VFLRGVETATSFEKEFLSVVSLEETSSGDITFEDISDEVLDGDWFPILSSFPASE
jgi:hypothetical protein